MGDAFAGEPPQSLGDLLQAIRTVSQGDLHLSAEYLPILHAFADGKEPAGATLTRREMQMLGLIAAGKSAKQAAAALGISPRTAESHRAHLKQKANIHDTAGLVRYAVRIGLVQPE